MKTALKPVPSHEIAYYEPTLETEQLELLRIGAEMTINLFKLAGRFEIIMKVEILHPGYTK